MNIEPAAHEPAAPPAAGPTAPPPEPEGVRLTTLAVAAVAFIVYGVATAPVPYLLDSAELADAAFTLGVAHPPGEPLAVLWGKLWTLLPLGSVAFRVGLGQAAAGAIAAAIVHRLLMLVAAHLDAEGRVSVRARNAVAAAGALLFALAPGCILSAVRPEVYAMQTALSLGALLAALRAAASGDARLVLVPALLIGLGMGTHPLCAGLTGVAAIVAVLPLLRERARGRRLAVAGVLAFLGGALVLAAVPLRAAAAPVLAWGDATSAGGLWWVLSAATFAGKSSIVQQSAQPGDAPFVIMDEIGPVAALVALVGIFILARVRRLRPLGAVLAVAGAGSTAAALVGGFDPANPDIRGYLGVAIAVAAILAAVAVLALLGALPSRRLVTLAATLSLVVPALGAPRAMRESSRRHAAGGDAVAAHLLGELPPRAALLTGYFQTAFLVGYLRHVEGQRPDVAWAHMGFVRSPGYAQRLFAREPDLGPLLGAYGHGELPARVLADLRNQRPLRFEVDLALPAPVLAALRPVGLTWSWDAGGDPAGNRAEGLRRAAELDRVIEPEAERDRELRGFLAWRLYLDTQLACRQRLTHRAQLGIKRLERLVPGDRLARQLAAECTTTAPSP